MLLKGAVAFGEDQALDYGREEDFFINREVPIGVTEAELQRLPLDAPELRNAYGFLIRAAMGGPVIVDERLPEALAALNDLRWRGDSATPLLLDIMRQNPNTRLETLTPLLVSRVETIDMNPYVTYIRQKVVTRADELSGDAAEVATRILLDFGSPEDIETMKELKRKRPFLAPYIERSFEAERRAERGRARKSGIAATEAAVTAAVPLPQIGQSAKELRSAAMPVAVASSESAATAGLPTLLGIAAVFVGAAGWIWLWLRRRVSE
jgi:hypothetical protein